MRFFKSIAAAVMMMSLPAAAVAQSDAAKSESEARAILNEMSQAAKACSTIEVSFTATYANKRTGDKHASDGSLKVKGDAYVWSKIYFKTFPRVYVAYYACWVLCIC